LAIAAVGALAACSPATPQHDRKPQEQREAQQQGTEQQQARAQQQVKAQQGTERQDATAEQRGKGLEGVAALDHVLIGVNDLKGAMTAYQRLGFTVIEVDRPGAQGPKALIDLGDGFLEFLTPAPDPAGKPQPYTFEGALAQGWSVARLDSVLVLMRQRGSAFDDPVSVALSGAARDRRGAGTWRSAAPMTQPVSGSAVFLVGYDAERMASQYRDLLKRVGIDDPVDHFNGAQSLAYVTIAVRHPDKSVEILKKWGLTPGPPLEDERGARTVRVPLERGALYLTAPISGGGINDFLEERRAHSEPLGERYYEGSIMSVGIGVENLKETIDYLTEKKIPYVPMNLPSGRTVVVQGAPGWALRLEFVETTGPGAGHRWSEDSVPTS
jgi:hypothetical protein